MDSHKKLSKSELESSQMEKQLRQLPSNRIQSETKNSNCNPHIAANNQRALELLLRIQSQLEASQVIATSSAIENNYE